MLGRCAIGRKRGSIGKGHHQRAVSGDAPDSAGFPAAHNRVADDNVSWLGRLTSLQDPNKPWLERSLSTFDIPSVPQFSYTYDFPVGHGKAFLGNMPRVLEAWNSQSA